MDSASRKQMAFLIACTALLAPLRSSSAQEGSIVGPATEEEIQTLIGDLGDPSYSMRTFATRRLCSIGSAALGALRKAESGDDVDRKSVV